MAIHFQKRRIYWYVEVFGLIDNINEENLFCQIKTFQVFLIFCSTVKFCYIILIYFRLCSSNKYDRREYKCRIYIKKKDKNVCMISNTLSWCIFFSAITGFHLISAFALLVGIPIGISSFALGLIISAITVGFKQQKSAIKKKRKKAW